jgi:hypothetical protein
MMRELLYVCQEQKDAICEVLISLYVRTSSCIMTNLTAFVNLLIYTNLHSKVKLGTTIHRFDGPAQNLSRSCR